MITYLYRFVVKSDKIAEFIAAWSALTEHFLVHESLGSRLHHGSDGIFYAYAQWPDEKTRAAAFSHAAPAWASKQMDDAVHERLTVLELAPVRDYLAPSAALSRANFAAVSTAKRVDREEILRGHHAELVPTHASHSEALFAALSQSSDDDWRYLLYGPFGSQRDFTSWFEEIIARSDLFFYTIIDKATATPLGLAALQRVDPIHGVIEIGNVHFSPSMRRTKLSDEAIALLLRHCFTTLGYRRCEWKCDALNQRSQRAALRHGFRYEGRFRNALIVKGLSRDTDWFSIIDSEYSP